LFQAPLQNGAFETPHPDNAETPYHRAVMQKQSPPCLRARMNRWYKTLVQRFAFCATVDQDFGSGIEPEKSQRPQSQTKGRMAHHHWEIRLHSLWQEKPRERYLRDP
jgi:hypothetical protein